MFNRLHPLLMYVALSGLYVLNEKFNRCLSANATTAKFLKNNNLFVSITNLPPFHYFLMEQRQG